jgi:hypothetical protein
VLAASTADRTAADEQLAAGTVSAEAVADCKTSDHATNAKTHRIVLMIGPSLGVLDFYVVAGFGALSVDQPDPAWAPLAGTVATAQHKAGHTPKS